MGKDHLIPGRGVALMYAVRDLDFPRSTFFSTTNSVVVLTLDSSVIMTMGFMYPQNPNLWKMNFHACNALHLAKGECGRKLFPVIISCVT